MKNYSKLFIAASAAAGGIYYAVTKRENLGTLNGRDHVTQSSTTELSKRQKAILKSVDAVNRIITKVGIPGVVVGVSINGENIWEQGIGLANVETETLCNAQTKMRIASISKPITVALLSKLVENNSVDLDKPIQNYVPYWPEKTVNGKIVTITSRLLACHKAGVRHYKLPEGSEGDGGEEFCSKIRYKTVEESVGIFKNDDLLFVPDEDFKYTTYGYTLLSAVIEGAGKLSFEKQIKKMFKDLSLKDLHLDEIPEIIYGRVNYYVRNKKGRLENAELTDNSCKWAGGGMVSTVGDLLRFGNIMLYSYQQESTDRPGYLKKETVQELWTPVPGAKTANYQYGLGWEISPAREGYLGSEAEPFHVQHTGGAVGASSILLIRPTKKTDSNNNQVDLPPSGIVVAILVNLESVSLRQLAGEIADNFHE